MARVKIPRPNADVRLKHWPPGRVSQLKLFLGHLEQAVGISLAAQVEQSPKRRFSEFVPKIVPQDITVDVEYREIRFFFGTPRGLKNLLFYEFDISLTAGFFNVDRFVSPDQSYVFSSLTDDVTYYLRVRVVTKNGEVGPWSDTETATTPVSQAFGLYDGTEYVRTIKDNAFYPWQIVYERQYTAIGGKTYYAVDYDVSVSRKWLTDANTEWTDVDFKWMDKGVSDNNFNQVGQVFSVSTYSTNGTGSQSPFYVFSVLTEGYTTPLIIPGQWENPRRGTFVQKFSTIETGAHTFRLEARVIKNHDSREFKNDFYAGAIGTDETGIVYGSNARIKLKNFNIFEALVD